MKTTSLFLLPLLLVFAGHLTAQTPPPAPTNLTAELLNSSMTPAVKLMWQSASGPWGFRIYRSVNDTDHFQVIAGSNVTHFVDRFVHPGGTYHYRVTAVGGNVGTLLESPPSNIASITIPGLPVLPKGTIAGTVIDDTTGNPIRGVRIRFFRANVSTPNMMPIAMTDSLGQYHALLDTGTYRIKADPPPVPSISAPRYRPEWYDDVTDPSLATPVTVVENQTFTANFGLMPLPPPMPAHISGTVADTAGNPLAGAMVAIMRTLQEMNALAALTGEEPGLGPEVTTLEGVGYTRGVLWHGRTDSLGNYTATVLANKSYIAMASKHGYLPEFFDNKSSPLDADIIHVTGDTSGIDFSLEPNPLFQNSISGVVRDSNGVFVPSRVVLLPVRVNAIGTVPHHVRFTHTDSMGAYTFANVRLGNYFLLAVPFSNYAPAFYKAGAYGVISRHDADTVVASGNVAGIDIGVVPIVSNGITRVSGRVRTTANVPLDGVSLLATTAQGTVVAFGLTDATGAYALEAVPPGTINIFVDREGYVPVEQNVSVPANTFNMGNIDFNLAPSSPTSAGPVSPFTPVRFNLDQNYPNPFNPGTTIQFDLPEASMVRVSIFNLLGQEIVNLLSSDLSAGRHEIVWNARDAGNKPVATGLYFYRLTASPHSGGKEFTQMKKMVLMK
jgi:hypothetical protein